MGFFSFIKEAGEKLWGGKEAQAATTAPTADSSAGAPTQQDLNAQAGAAIAAYVHAQGLGLLDLQVEFDALAHQVTVRGQAPTQAIKEKVTLCCGNVAHVERVENLMTVVQTEPEAQFHDVVRGDTLSAIAKKFYGDANKYPAIFEANRPMLAHPDKIYPGQKLRIPVLG